MKLWHDDIRPAPEGWVWARTNLAAMEHLRTGAVEEISMDHDLGMHDYTEDEINLNPDLILYAGKSMETGLDLAKWMATAKIVPPKIRVHSWNPSGAMQMALVLHDANPDAEIEVRPFDLRERG